MVCLKSSFHKLRKLNYIYTNLTFHVSLVIFLKIILINLFFKTLFYEIYSIYNKIHLKYT